MQQSTREEVLACRPQAKASVFLLCNLCNPSGLDRPGPGQCYAGRPVDDETCAREHATQNHKENGVELVSADAHETNCRSMGAAAAAAAAAAAGFNLQRYIHACMQNANAVTFWLQVSSLSCQELSTVNLSTTCLYQRRVKSCRSFKWVARSVNVKRQK